MPDLTVVSCLTCGIVAETTALIYVFKRMETLITRGHDREDRMLNALLGKLHDTED